MQILPFKTEEDFQNAAPPPEGYYLRWVKQNADGTVTEYVKDHTGTVQVLNAGDPAGEGIPATATEDAVTDPDTGIATVKLRPVTITETGAEWDGAEVTAIVGWTAPPEEE